MSFHSTHGRPKIYVLELGAQCVCSGRKALAMFCGYSTNGDIDNLAWVWQAGVPVGSFSCSRQHSQVTSRPRPIWTRRLGYLVTLASPDEQQRDYDTTTTRSYTTMPNVRNVLAVLHRQGQPSPRQHLRKLTNVALSCVRDFSFECYWHVSQFQGTTIRNSYTDLTNRF